MTVAFDAFTANANQTADFNFNHTPVGTPSAVIVWVIETGATADHIAGITYGGDAMTEVAGSPNILSTGETGIAYCYFLGTSIPTGTQSVSVDTTATSNYIAYCVTLTAANDTTVVDSDGTINSTSITNPSVTLSLSGKTSWAGLAFHSGAQTVGNITPLTNWTSRSETDRGATQAACYTYNTIDSADVTAGWTQTTEDAAAVCIAVTDVQASLFERTCADSVTVSPAVVRTFIAVRSISQSVTISDSLARLKTAIRDLAQSITISDVVAEAALKFRTMADSITISDAISRIKIFPRAIAESISISPAISSIAVRVIAIAQSITISDSVSRVKTAIRGLVQSVTISDAIEAHKLLIRQIAQSITVSDSVVRLKTAIRAISETITISDSLTKVATKIRTMADSITISDSISKTLVRVITIAQSITVSDSVSRIKTAIRGISETITISDAVTRLKTAIRNISQSITISDAVARLFIPGGVGQLFQVFINETISLSDSISLAIFKVIGGRPPGGNIFRRRFEKRMKAWRVDWRKKLNKRIGIE